MSSFMFLFGRLRMKQKTGEYSTYVFLLHAARLLQARCRPAFCFREKRKQKAEPFASLAWTQFQESKTISLLTQVN